METYCQEIRKLEDTFDGLQIHRVIRWDNFAADILAKIGFGRDPILNGVFLMNSKKTSIRPKRRRTRRSQKKPSSSHTELKEEAVMVINPEWTEAASPTSTTSSETPYHKIDLRQDASQNELGLMS